MADKSNISVIGRRLRGDENASFIYLTQQLKRGEKLYGLYSYYGSETNMSIEQKATFDELNRRIDSGWLEFLGYYAVWSDKTDKLVDEARG